ncbi:acyltransferase family protein [uncultured Traorella sp.]|uniref:acyltransferase n=1 Tax=uncultured Traorella sp. TaxID=1929048 RepID=UPI0025EACAAF|nr:acyltransferase family protein [uncultured Traorella sp.]
MEGKQIKRYGDLDIFRLAAAMMVIMIHTSPLSTYDTAADFFLTRVLARTAVPFFFMVSGHFVCASALLKENKKGLISFLKKNMLIYGFISLCYLPIALVAGLWDGSIWELIRMLFFEGVFYHLWYFPACIVGCVVIAFLFKKINRKGLFIICILLYLLGLFGDSYYGISVHIPIVADFYERYFQFFSYTRMFMAPVFLFMGICLSQRKESKKKLYPVILWLFVMSIEAFILRHFHLQRHDSMYLFLLPLMVYLFDYLKGLSIPSMKKIRTIATLIYLIHPAVILLLRGFAKMIHQVDLLVGNSLIFSLSVILFSFLLSCLFVYSFSWFKKFARLRQSFK